LIAFIVSAHHFVLPRFALLEDDVETHRLRYLVQDQICSDHRPSLAW